MALTSETIRDEKFWWSLVGLVTASENKAPVNIAFDLIDAVGYYHFKQHPEKCRHYGPDGKPYGTACWTCFDGERDRFYKAIIHALGIFNGDESCEHFPPVEEARLSQASPEQEGGE